MNEIAAFTIVRRDETFLKLWVEYYGQLLGRENLFIVLDGDDWEHPEFLADLNTVLITDVPGGKGKRNGWSARFASDYAAKLLERYSCVLRADIDEFVILDPNVEIEFEDYILSLAHIGCVSALGLDVIHNKDKETAINLVDQAILEQRRHAVITREFTKPCIIFNAINWGAGFHRADFQKVVIDPNIYMIHLALFDFDHALERIRQRKSVSRSESLDVHIENRMARFAEATAAECIPGDQVFEKARRQISAPKRNGKIRTRTGFITKDNNVARGYLIEIPERFKQAL